MQPDRSDAARRNFLRWLAAAPLAAGAVPVLQALAQQAPPKLIKSASEALNVFELEAVARQIVPPAHWGYLAGGVLGDRTIQSNARAYDNWGIRARRLVDVSKIDLSTTIFGETYKSPIALCPVSSLRAFHTDGEIAAANAAKTRGALQMLSTLTTYGIEDVMKARGAPVWQQLYLTNRTEVGEKVLDRAQAAGASAIVFTIDLLGGGQRRETQALGERNDNRDCNSCHNRTRGYDFARKRMFDNLDLTGVVTPNNNTLTWSYLARLRDKVKTRLLVKGVMTAEDADLAIRHGVDGIIVSNHGGRAEESLIGTLDVLPTIAQTVARRVPILIDGGIRRGTDAFKALALGANMVCVGRPYVWGLGAFGQDGVTAAMSLLDNELASTMQQAGVTSLAGITRDCVVALR